MQFGIFTVGDVTPDPTTGRVPSEAERIKAMVAVEAVTGADGLIAVTPIFNASYSGLFKRFVDVVERDSMDGKPVLLGATGGTERHSLAVDFAMRPLFAYLRAPGGGEGRPVRRPGPVRGPAVGERPPLAC